MFTNTTEPYVQIQSPLYHVHCFCLSLLPPMFMPPSPPPGPHKPHQFQWSLLILGKTKSRANYQSLLLTPPSNIPLLFQTVRGNSRACHQTSSWDLRFREVCSVLVIYSFYLYISDNTTVSTTTVTRGHSSLPVRAARTKSPAASPSAHQQQDQVFRAKKIP